MLRRIKVPDIVGKTVKSIDNTCVNSVKLVFEDGSELELIAEQAVHTSFGSIPGIFVESP